jgi:hypothetical protein
MLFQGQFVNGKKAGIWQFWKGKQAKEIDMSNPQSSQNPQTIKFALAYTVIKHCNFAVL